MKTATAALFALAALATLSACNTVQGVGKDVSGAGKAVTNSSESVQKKIP